MPRGLDTVIGTKGRVPPPGGSGEDSPWPEPFKGCPDVVLDEATAFADPDKVLIQQAFEKLVEGKTVIMIAHRLSTVAALTASMLWRRGVSPGGREGGGSQGRQAVRRNVEEWYQSSVEWKVGKKRT